MPRTGTAVDKRIVVTHMAGPLAGIREIAGTAAQLTTDGVLPSYIANVGARGRNFDIRLSKVEKTYAMYTEVVPSPTEDDGA